MVTCSSDPVLVADPDERTDEALLDEYRTTGDVELFNQIVRRYEAPLYGYLCRFLNDTVLAEDVFQQTFLQVHLKSNLFDAKRKVRPWIYTIATNQAIDATRRNRRHRHYRLDNGSPDGESLPNLADGLAGDEPQPWARMDRQERNRTVRGAVDRLSAPLRQVIQLIYFQGLKYQEAADVLSLPVGTVKSRVHAAMAKLRTSPIGTADLMECDGHAIGAPVLMI